MLEIKNFSMQIKDRILISDLNLTLNKKDKLGIIGEEGNGKSSLLKGILGLADYGIIKGNINTHGNKIGYLEQSINEKDLEKEVHEYLFKDDNDYYNKISDFYKYISKFKLTDKILKQTMKELSGGEKIKISIIKLLLEDSDILFLDEPTNDIDLDALEWLENFIKNTEKIVVFVSHDETLLSKTANMILHIEQIKKKSEPRHTLLKTDYNTYINLRLNKIEKETQIAINEKRNHNKKEEKLRRIMEKVEYRQRTITRSDPHGGQLLKKKMHSLKSQERKLENEKLTEIPDVEESINIFFDEIKMPKNKVVLKLEIPELKIQNRVLSKNIRLEIIGSKHICIIGNNGVGKTTLIKEIYNNLKTREDIKVGYMPQNYDEILNQYETVLSYISVDQSKEKITESRMLLGNMNFTKEEMTGKIENLSGGTKAKLFLMKLVIDKCNVLILDEPTRNLSPLSNPVIRKILKNFTGTIISVSHDRKYIDEVADTIYTLSANGLTKQK